MMAPAHRLGHEPVQLTIVEEGARRIRLPNVPQGEPDRQIQFDRLRHKLLVGQNAYERVEPHAFQGDTVACHHGRWYPGARGASKRAHTPPQYGASDKVVRRIDTVLGGVRDLDDGTLEVAVSGGL